MKIIRNISTISLIFLSVACSGQKTTTSERKQPTQQKAPTSIDELFKMDINGYGKLTKLEVTGPILKDFDKIDINKDGFITRAELGEAPRHNGPPQGGGQGGPPPRR